MEEIIFPYSKKFNIGFLLQNTNIYLKIKLWFINLANGLAKYVITNYYFYNISN